MNPLKRLGRRSLLRGFELYAGRAFRRLEWALQNPEQAQQETLQAVLQQAAWPELGPVPSLEAFFALPLQGYEDLAPRIETARQRGQGFLSQERPFGYEPTSGSSGARKLIPYTRPLMRSFTEMFLCWAHDLLRHGPPLRGGSLYFSVSPQFKNAQVPGAETGLQDDSDYLTGPTASLLKLFSAAPPTLRLIQDPQAFFRILSLYLLAADDLEIISVWSPSFLLSLLEQLVQERRLLAELGAQHEITWGELKFRFGGLAQAKRQLLQRASTAEFWQPEALQVLFPTLKLISCWGAQNARVNYLRLQALFPQVLVQEKGLLATEAPISIPSQKHGTFLPLLQEVYFEFLDAEGHLLRLHELALGQSYELVLSQKGGLLRYRIQDQVKVVACVLNTPCFDFVGRSEAVSDLVGEKLNEDFVAELIQRLLPEHYGCLVPRLEPAAYLLCLEASSGSLEPLATGWEADVRDRFEAALRASPHYHNARQLNQLKSLQICAVPRLSAGLKDYFEQERGLRRGDLKDRYLYSHESDGRLWDYLCGLKSPPGSSER